MTKRIILIILILLLVVGIIAGVKMLQIRTMIEKGGSFVPPPETVTSAEVQQQEWEETIKAVGSLEAVQGVMIASEIAGKVARIAFTPGTRVQAGDLLVQLDIDQEKAQLRAAEAAASLAKTEMDRIAEILADKSVSQSEYDKAAATYKEAVAQVDTIKALIAKKTIRAPFAGRLGIRLVNLGQIISEGEAIVTLQSLDPIFVNFQLPQHELTRVQQDFPIRLTIDNINGGTIIGTITTISPEIESTTRNFRLQATVANNRELLHPGMFTEVAVVLPKKKQVMIIPATAILYAPYSDSVFVIEERTDKQTGKPSKFLRQQFVRLGERRGDFVEVVSGLKADETVVSTGVFKLRNGQAVIIDNSLNPEFKLAPQPSNQ
ncbi:MAG: efflux RND transporter periplasmic adaptor subunit [Desulfobulbales bacterium]